MDLKEGIDQLASLMEEFHLDEASFEFEGARVAFRRKAAVQNGVPMMMASGLAPATEEAAEAEPYVEPAPEAPKGTPITSPMNGIFYSTSNPSSPPFVKVGDTITAGQVVGLIEAMKVFNEIPATVSGTVLSVLFESGEIVQPGDVLMYVG